MNRKIKFRAYNTISNKMVSHKEIIADFMLYEELCEPIQRNIFMQCSSLKDKCDMEIYDGDIIELPSYPGDGLDKYVVEFFGDCFRISDYRSTLEEYDDRDDFDYYYHHGESLGEHKFGACVVGNIYENKELLNG